MYQSQFHLHGRPFAAAPNPEHYFPASTVEEAREAIAMNVQRSSGTTMLMGPVGVGKTLLCQLIANHFAGEFPVCMVAGERLTNREMLLQAILHRLEIPFRQQKENELRITLMDHVMGQSCPNGILLIIDEADRLSLSLLEELRVITNLVKDGEPRVRLLLAGASRLEERVAHPKLESLNQRVVGRLYLSNFSTEETADYVRTRITTCGGEIDSIFSPEALETVFLATHGVPRLINQICDHALVMSANSHQPLSHRSIEDAWADLQQLPIPVTAPAIFQPVAREDEASVQYVEPVESDEVVDLVVEYGTLDEDDDSLDQQIRDVQEEVAELREQAGAAMFDTSDQRDDTRPEYVVEVEDIGTPEPMMNRSSPFADEIELYQPDEDDEDPLDQALHGRLERFDDESDPVAAAEELVTSITSEDETPDVLAEDAVPDVDAEGELTLEAVYEIGHAVELDPVAGRVGMDDAADEVDTIENHDSEIGDSEIEAEVIDSSEDASDEIDTVENAIEISEKDAADVQDETDDVIEIGSYEAIVSDVEITMDQASNPFDEDFEEEEIVIQEFASPNGFFRNAESDVTSVYSRRLATQLEAAHPGLRMLVADPIVIETAVAETDEDGFQPLSAYLADAGPIEDATPEWQPAEHESSHGDWSVELMRDGDTETDQDTGVLDAENAAIIVTFDSAGEQADFDPASDPVMPDSSMAVLLPTVDMQREVEAEQFTDDGSEAELGSDLTSDELTSEDELTSDDERAADDEPPHQLSIHADGVSTVANVEEIKKNAQAKKERVFRSLFSQLRRA